jgi:hypothetical protein
LVLDYYFMGERPVPLIDVICLFPALQHLQIFTMAGNWAVPPLGVLPPKDLHTLVLRGISPSRVLAWLLAYNHLPNVDSLTLDRRLSPADVSTVRVALDRIGGALHHLDIDLGGLSEGTFTSRFFVLQSHVLQCSTFLSIATSEPSLSTRGTWPPTR